MKFIGVEGVVCVYKKIIWMSKMKIYGAVLLTLYVPKKNIKKLTLSGFRKYIISRKYSAGSTSHHYAINHAFNMIYDFKAISMDNWQLSTTLHHFLPFQRIRCEEILLSYKWWVGKISILCLSPLLTWWQLFFFKIVTAIFFYFDIENHSLIVSSQPNEVEAFGTKSFVFTRKQKKQENLSSRKDAPHLPCAWDFIFTFLSRPREIFLPFPSSFFFTCCFPRNYKH